MAYGLDEFAVASALLIAPTAHHRMRFRKRTKEAMVKVATVLAVLNSAILALLDHCRITNARLAMRTFAAFPERALALLTQPL